MIDVCLLLEGSYPYVAGGVSTWVHQFITAMGDIRFGLVCISPHSDPTRTVKYDIPPHVVFIKDIYLHDYDLENRAPKGIRNQDLATLRSFYARALDRSYEGFAEALKLFRGKGACFDVHSFFTSREVWHLLVEFYDKLAQDVSFLDFFWTWRGVHLPLFPMLQADIPQAKIYHAISTGYAGFLGAIAKVTLGGHFFLTEHGIYTHERMLEISQANWIFEKEKRSYRAESELSFFKRWWIGIFRFFSDMTYQYAERIFTLYEGNKVREVMEGAPPGKIQVIPNGIDLAGFEAVRRERRATPHIGLVGRVVSIKDVKTFIQAAKLVLQKLPDAQFYVIGPTDEEPDYYDECKVMAEHLKLYGKLTFTGRVDVKEYYSFLDLVVLTSLSEAQPFVILEANILGIPVVASDVGACREMLEGLKPKDKALGPSGLVTEVANPESTAQAMIRLMKEATFYGECARAGEERVKKFYDQNDLLSRYLNIYEQHL